jgi:ribosomal protein S18 acetylase RimI-like enzyme
MQRWRDDFAPAAEKNLPLPPATDEMSTGFRNAVLQGECSMLLSWKDVLAAYSAHLHIDILPEFQQRGYGRELMGAFLEKVKNEGAEGVHLDMVRHNVGARRFYEKLGFEACPVVMDEGASGEVGVQGVVVTLVRKL